MPFPWKKVKSIRISRLLNDHLHNSQKRRDGSSLVVETGFPTSLIDLFIKNREKLKNSSKKKRETSLSVPSQNDPVIAPGSPTLFPSPPQSPSRSNSQVIAGLPLNFSSPLRRSASLLHLPLGVNEIDVGDRDGGGAESKCGVERVVDANGVILVAVKIFLVAVLALWAKRLTVGITMSALFLCFLECAGKHLRELFKPCSKARGWLISVVQKVPKLRYKDLWKVRQEEFDPSLNGCDSMHLTQMIEIEKPNHYPIILIDEIQSEKEIVEDSFSIGRSRNQKTESNEVVIGKEKRLFGVAKLRRKLRKDKIKSKMKLIVPKKFWSLRKDHNFRKLKIVQEDKVTVSGEQGMDECEDESESETTTRLSSTSNGRFKEDVMNSVCAVGGLPEIDEEVAKNNEVGSKETKSGMTWSNFVPCLTVLIGLIGGRPVALLLTLSWFLVLKFGKTLPGYREVAMIKSFDDRSG
ncbi:uncharacterized protein [Primulina huaijiensis]|uniref:uncharacterized protein n=1 Tax=Primulina huaijiensis TaxID=1492673 RepID=UPI003CC74759